jgi:hypothetical protein
MGWLQDLLQEVPLSSVLKERVALAEDRFESAKRGGPVFRNRMAALLRWILGSITPPISPRFPA